MKTQLNTSDTGYATDVFVKASILFAYTSAYNAENSIRQSHGYTLAYNDEAYIKLVKEFFPEKITNITI